MVIAASLVLAAALRFTGLGFGRGALYPRPDEELLRSAVLISLGGDLNPHYAVWGHLYHYLHVAVGAVYLGLGVLSGQHESWADALAAAYCAPTTFEILGRAISATAGTLTLLATYRLARNTLRSRLAATCSCILLSTVFLHVRDSHFATCDMLLTYTVTAALAAMTGPQPGRARRAAVWTGLALASKLLALTVVATYLTVLVLTRLRRSTRDYESRPLVSASVYLLLSGCIALAVQPFLILDPMQTWFGLFGDLFNPERRPFEHGLRFVNASIVARYYVPQAVGWLLAAVAVAGGLHMLRRWATPRFCPLIVFTFWSLLALVSVERIFLRYLDPLLPIASVFAAHAVATACRWVVAGQTRVVMCLVASALAALPNLWRDVWLDHRLLQPDTRALAGEWIEANVPPGSRILWSGFEMTPPHLMMPRLHTPESHDQEYLAFRSRRGLPAEIDTAIMRWKDEHEVPRYSLVNFAFGKPQREQSVFDAFPMVDRHYDIAWLQALDRWSRHAGWLTRAEPRQDLVHRSVTGAVVVGSDDLGQRKEEFLAVAGLPPNPAVTESVSQYYTEVARFSPGARAVDLYNSGHYDQGDAWYLPNGRIHRVDRPGPEIRIFRRSSDSINSGR